MAVSSKHYAWLLAGKTALLIVHEIRFHINLVFLLEQEKKK